jgi:hypothetical protein
VRRRSPADDAAASAARRSSARAAKAAKSDNLGKNPSRTPRICGSTASIAPTRSAIDARRGSQCTLGVLLSRAPKSCVVAVFARIMITSAPRVSVLLCTRTRAAKVQRAVQSILDNAFKEGMICPCLIEARDRRELDRPVIPDAILGHGNNMSFKRDLFRKVGLFTESLGAGTKAKGGEDTEFIYRALRRHAKFIYSPTPLVFHDNWLSKQQFAELMSAYVLAGTAVFTNFACQMDKTAIMQVLGTAYNILRYRKGIRSTARGVLTFLMGVGIGVRYLFEVPPKLSESVVPAAAPDL